MPSLASGNMSCTAWASTWAAECRMTLRPVVAVWRRRAGPRRRRRASSSGRAACRRRRPPRRPPPARRGRAVRPRGPPHPRWSRQEPGSGLRGRAVRGRSSGYLQWSVSGWAVATMLSGWLLRNRFRYGLCSHGWSIPTHPAIRSSAPTTHSVPTTTTAVSRVPDRAEPECLPAEPRHDRVVAALGELQGVVRPGELAGQDPQPDEHDGPAGPGVRDGDDAADQHHGAGDADQDAVGGVGRPALPQPLSPPFAAALSRLARVELDEQRVRLGEQAFADPSYSVARTKILRPSTPVSSASTV